MKAGFHYTRLPCARKMFSCVQQHGIVVNRVVTEPNQPITAKDLYALTRELRRIVRGQVADD